MADLNTKTLNELDTITEMGENDKVLVESNGMMKRCSGSLGSGVYILNRSDFSETEGGLK